MGELILCGQTLAAMPFYLEGGSCNVYSLEELSYYIAKNACLLDVDFMSEELCRWIGEEMHLPEVEKKLRGMCGKKDRLPAFVSCILSQSGFCSDAESAQIERTLRELEKKSDFERSKMRADQDLRVGRYAHAVSVYMKLLGDEDELRKNPAYAGNLWHNVGTAYAGQFFFADAAECYRKAYAINKDPASLCQRLYALWLAGDAAGFDAAAAEGGLGTAGIARLKEELSGRGKTSLLGEPLERLRKRLAAHEESYRSGCMG